MARYSATIASPQTPEEVFAYLADFRSAAEWDPSVTQSVLVSEGEPVRVGATFEVTTSNKVSKVVLSYRTVELERPNRIVLRGENDVMTADDVITIAADGTGSAVTYAADIRLKGLLKLADPLLQLGFGRLGDKARDGLAAKLAVAS